MNRERLHVLLSFVSLAAGALVACASPSAGLLDEPSGESGATANGPAGSADGGARGAGADGGAAGGAASGLPCDVSDVLASKCQSCHGASPSYGAPMPLVTYADLTAPAKTDASKKVYELVEARIHDDAHLMPPSPYPRLDLPSAQALDAWIDAGAPRSNDACNGGATGGAPKPLSCTPDTFIRGAAPVTMPSGQTDVYMCYGFDVTTTAKRHVIALAPKIDDAKIVHHLLLFQADASYPSTPQPCDAFGSAAWQLITGWAPGGENLELPKEAGFPEEGTTHWIMQVHYNDVTGAHAGEQDHSGYDLCTTDQLRPNDADVMAFGLVDATLPPHATTDITCDWTPELLPDMTITGTSPHMHKLGSAMSTYIHKANGGGDVKIVDQSFDFNTQLDYPASAVLQSGDTVSTRCVWNNTTDQTVTWGEGTGDEMCFNFVQYYPKITSGIWSWALPSALANCHPTK